MKNLEVKYLNWEKPCSNQKKVLNISNISFQQTLFSEIAYNETIVQAILKFRVFQESMANALIQQLTHNQPRTPMFHRKMLQSLRRVCLRFR